MNLIKIGPKKYRSIGVPMGLASAELINVIQQADQGKLKPQIFRFDLEVSNSKTMCCFVINGSCRFKIYGPLDVLFYKIAQKINRIFGQKK